MKNPSLVILLASVCLSGVASAAWHRLPSAESEPVNLANPIVLGTEVHSSSGITNLSALIADSSAEAAKLAAGKSEAVLSVGDQQLIEGVGFLNDGAAGKLVVSGSTDLKEWLLLAQATYTATERQVSVKFAGAQLKYVRFAFENENAATIRSIKLNGPATTKDYKAVPVKDAKAVDVNLASSSLGARPIYMFPTPTNAGENGQQSFKFTKTSERFRTVVYDLGAVRTIKKFNAAYSRVPTRVQVFAFEALPEKKDWRGKMTLEPAIFDEQKPVATGEDARGEGSIQLVPERPVQAQYVALRFEPNYNKQRAVAGRNTDWEAMAFAAVAPLSGIAKELGLFEMGTFTQAATAGDESEEDFVVYDAAAGGSVPLVMISRSAIAMALSKLPSGTSELAAVNAILTAAGFTPISNLGGTEGGTAGGGSSKPQAQTADPGLGGWSTAGFNALGLSAYRGGGGGTGGSPFESEQTTTIGTNPPTDNNNNNGGNPPTQPVTNNGGNPPTQPVTSNGGKNNGGNPPTQPVTNNGGKNNGGNPPPQPVTYNSGKNNGGKNNGGNPPPQPVTITPTSP